MRGSPSDNSEFYVLRGDVGNVNGSRTVMGFVQDPVTAPHIGSRGEQGFSIAEVAWRFEGDDT